MPEARERRAVVMRVRGCCVSERAVCLDPNSSAMFLDLGICVSGAVSLSWYVEMKVE